MPRPAPGTHSLTYGTSAQFWTDALPIGNGRIGAMIYGGPNRDRWQINDDTCWSGHPGTAHGQAASTEPSPEVIERVRGALFAGDIPTAEREIRKVQYGHSQSYQPLADLQIATVDFTEPLQQRSLDLGTAIATWRTASAQAEVFASAPAAAIVGRYQWATPQTITLRLDAAHRDFGRSSVTAEDSALVLTSRMPTDVAPTHDRADDPIRYDDGRGQAVTAALVAAVRSDGEVTADHEQLTVRNASWIQVAVCTATDFIDPRTPPHGDIDRLVTIAHDRAETVAGSDFDGLRQEHVTEYKQWFDRFDLQLGDNADDQLDTDALLERSRTGDVSPRLVALLVQYGRYLMISSSRPGSRAINLQGIWNPYLQPPWSSNYTVNINTEMNYWPAPATNLMECAEPLYQLVETMAETGAETARRVYGRPGWSAHHNSDVWGYTLPVGTGDANPCWAAWPMAGFWLLRHFWEHHEYTGDQDFLAKRFWPLLDGAVQFGLDTLITLPDGSLGVAPSTSPENSYLTDAGTPAAVTTSSTMDIALLRDTFRMWQATAPIVRTRGGLVDEQREKAINAALPQLTLPEPTERGTYPEWQQDLPEAEPTHRHQSHLYDLHPGNAVDIYTSEHAPRIAAMNESLRRRGIYSTGWSLGWRISLHARLHNTDLAMASLEYFLRPVPTEIAAAGPKTAQAGGVYRNLFCAHPPFQIDGNFGATAGVLEMLVQSHGHHEGKRILDLLPCLPAQWPDGSVRGVRARGGLVLDLSWSAGTVTELTIKATIDQSISLRLPDRDDIDLHLEAGDHWHLD